MKFRQFADRKRALVSRLMQRRMCQLVLDEENFDNIEISRTKGKKPFLHRPRPEKYPNFNYNISHEGKYVVCSSETTCLCGVDVAADQGSRNDAYDSSFLRDFHEQLTPYEWREITRKTEEDQYEMFQRFWSCKEAFVKARGDGLMFPLGHVEFDLKWVERSENKPIEVRLKLDGKPDLRWRLYQSLLPDKHWVTIARGPISDVQDADGVFASTLLNCTFTNDEWETALTAPMPEFEEFTVADLLPKALSDKYAAQFPVTPVSRIRSSGTSADSPVNFLSSQKIAGCEKDTGDVNRRKEVM